MRTISEVIENEIPGLYYGNRILLPFKAEILKIVFDDKIVTDFSGSKYGAKYSITDSYTEIYLLDLKDLKDQVSEFEKVKLTVVESGKDIFDMSNHTALAFSVKNDHHLSIEKIDDDTLYFE